MPTKTIHKVNLGDSLPPVEQIDQLSDEEIEALFAAIDF